MTQPATAPQGGGIGAVLGRRIGPAPVWVYFVVLVVAGAWFLHRRAQKAATANTTALNSDANVSPNLTTQSGVYIPYPQDTFVNVQQPGAPGPTGPTGPTGPAGPAGPSSPSGTSAPFPVSAGTGTDLYQFAAAHGGWATVRQLNTWFDQNIRWGPDRYPDGSLVPHVATGRQYLVTQ